MNRIGETTVSVQDRCPNMRDHIDRGEVTFTRKQCPQCYSVIVTTVRVPFIPAQARKTVVNAQ